MVPGFGSAVAIAVNVTRYVLMLIVCVILVIPLVVMEIEANHVGHQ